MKHRRWIRALALVLVCALTVFSPLTAGAAQVVGDLNGDGKISVFDAQLILEKMAGLRELNITGSITADNIVAYVLGERTVDAGDLNNDGVMEIYTAAGLQELHNWKDGSFILMNDLDMQGIAWTPVVGFNGILNGNGKTVSNLTISTDSADSRSSSILNMGFLGDTETSAQIRDLHLRNVTLTATENVRSIGMLAGTLRGTASNCTVTGSIIDTREAHAAANYIGVMAGRLASGSNGQIIGGTAISVTDEKNNTTTGNLCADAKLLLTSRDNVMHSGLAGYAYSAAAVSGQWVDTTHSSSLLSESIQARQQTVVDYMHAMGTVKWTPSETMTFTSSNKAINQTYTAGVTYTGLPYNGHNGSMERFLSVMESQDADTGIYTASALGDGGWTVDGVLDTTGSADGAWSDTGFYMYMGNDCSSAVGWAWMQISNVTTKDAPEHSIPYKGGVYVTTTPLMIPNETNRYEKGIYPVGSWSASKLDENNKRVTAFDPAYAAYQCTDELYGADVLNNNGYDTIIEAYAQTHKADALVAYVEKWNANAGGHARLVVADPVVIRESDGSINDTMSYFICTEQGVNFSATSTTRWHINRKYTFKALTATDDNGVASASSKTYLPVTIRALKENTQRDTYLIQLSDNPIVSPAQGSIYSYHRINSVTVTVTDNTGKVYYDREAFTGVSLTTYRSRNQSATLEELHADAFYEAAAANGMVDGRRYRLTVQVLLSTGESQTLVNRETFTYAAPTAE